MKHHTLLVWESDHNAWVALCSTCGGIRLCKPTSYERAMTARHQHQEVNQ